MAKRFTDNEKWKDTWFIDLPTKYKLFWIYILDECNHAGIWKVNFKVASFFIGEHLEDSEVKRILKDRIIVLNDQYWYVNKFIKYQYKLNVQELNPKNKLHLSVLKLLNEYKEFKPLTSPLLGVKDKDKDIYNIINTNNIIKYTKKEFLEDWNELRKQYLKKPSFLNSLQRDSNENFNQLINDYDRQSFRNALVGLFKQKMLPNNMTSMQSNPRHFLTHFESYLTAYHDKNDSLYGKKENEY